MEEELQDRTEWAQALSEGRLGMDTTSLCSCDQYINPLGKVCREDEKVMYLSESEQDLKISRIIWLSTRVLQPQIAVTVS